MPILTQGQITISDLTDGINGTSSYTHIRYSANANGNPMTTVATGAMYIGVVATSSATAPTGYASYGWSLIKGDKGDAGDNSISGVLSNDSHTIATDSAGNGGSFTNAVSTIKIFNGTVDDSANWAVTVAVSNVTGTLSGKTYTVATLTADTGYVDFTATRSGFASVVKRFTLTKSKQGTTGGSGTTPTTYWLVNSAPVISKSATAVYAPSTITVTGKAQTGTGSPVDYAGRFIISDSPDGTTFTARYTSSANEVSKVYTPLANIKALKVQFYLAGGTTTLLDEQVIAIVSDGAKGDDGGTGLPAYIHIAYATSADGSVGFSTTVSSGKTYIGTYSDNTAAGSSSNTAYSWSLIKGADGSAGIDSISGVLSNDAHAVATDSAGNGGVYTGAVSTMKIFKGIVDDSANWAVTVAVSGVTGSLVGKTYTATGLSADTGYVDFTATRSGYASVVKRFTVSKTKQGATGGTGGTGGQGPTGPAGELNLVNNPHNSGNTTGWSATTYGTEIFADGRTVGVGNIISSGNGFASYTNFNIEPQKMYEFSVWMKQNTTKSANYFGLYVYNSAGANIGSYPISTSTGVKTTTLNTNLYFWSGTLTAEVWVKCTGYVIPAGYDTSDLDKFKNLGENVTFVTQFPSDANKATMRVLNYSNTVSTTLSMAFPMVKEVDISVLEANKAKNIQDLWRYGSTVEIDGGKLRANTVTATQINVANLSALSANLGNVTAGTMTGVTMNAANMNLTNSGNFKATNTTLGADTNFEIKDGLFSHAVGDSTSLFGFYDGDVDAVKGMYGNSSQGRIAFGSGYLFQAANGRMAFQKTVASVLEAGGYWTDGGVETGYLWVKSTSDVSGTSSNTGIMVGNPSSGNLKMDWNEISAFGNGTPAELHVNPDGGRVVFNNNGVGGNLVIDGGEIVNQGRISPSLQNGWVNYSAAGGTYAIAGYWKDKNGVVHLSGLIKSGTTATGTLILTLPVGYRPVGTYMFACHSPWGASYNTPRLDLGADGRLTIQTVASASWLSLAGISFKTE